MSSADSASSSGPNLLSLSPVLWVETMSFLEAHEICIVSSRVARSLGGGDNEDSAEKAAKLALVEVQRQAFKAKEQIELAVGNADNFDEHNFRDQYRITLFEGESFLRLYHLTLALLDDRKTGTRTDETLDNRKDDDTCCYPLVITLWLLIGKPWFPPLSDKHYDNARAITNKILRFLSPHSDGKDQANETNETVRSALKRKLDDYCRLRILLIADRLRMLGLWNEGICILNVLSYGRPHSEAHALDADYYVGSRVILHGLSKAELNDKTGTVEVAFNPSNGRFGIRLDGREKRLVGIKPTNLRATEVETAISMDQKLVSALLTCECLDMQCEAMEPSCATVFNGLSKNVHLLRRIVEVLRTKIETEAEEDACQEVDRNSCSTILDHGNCFYGFFLDHLPFASDSLRLIVALFALNSSLVHLARYAGNRRIEYGHGGVYPKNDEGEDLTAEMIKVIGCPEEDRHLLVTSFLLREASDVYGVMADTIKKKFNQPDALGMYAHWDRDSLKNMSFDISLELESLQSTAFSRMLECAGVLTRYLGFPFLARWGDNGPNLTMIMNEHLFQAAASYRFRFEWILDAISRKEEPLSLDSLFSEDWGKTVRQNTFRLLMRLAAGLAEVYWVSHQLGTSPFKSAEEDLDAEHFFCLALALGIRTIGPGHDVCHRISRFVEVSAGYSGLEEHDRLNADVNSWLVGGYRCLYHAGDLDTEEMDC